MDVTRTHLELHPLDRLQRPAPRDGMPDVAECTGITAERYLALYRLVGAQWHWRDRLAWRREQLEQWLARADVRVFEAVERDATAGFFELAGHHDGSVEIMYFGLAPGFLGRGIGGWLLARAVDEAARLGAERVILNTCTLDAPQALPNYLARGFRITREERYEEDVSVGRP